MAKNYFYASTSDTNLAKQIMAGCCNVFIQKHEYRGTALLNLNAGGDDYLLLDDSDAAANDDYNSSVADNLFIIDNNSKLARGKVKDTFSDTGGTEISFEASDMVLVEDGLSAPTLTDENTYTVVVLSGSNTNLFGDYFGLHDDSLELDTTIESEPLEVCTPQGTMVEIAENPTKRMCNVTGATFNVPNKDVISKVLNMIKYGDNTTSGKEEYHGGSAPNINVFYQITLLGIDFVNKNLGFTLFKGQLIPNAAIGFSGTGWKKVSWQYKGKRDEVRDSYEVDMFKYLRYS
jgi:hypothetical protein